jgi:hypothetical protein
VVQLEGEQTAAIRVSKGWSIKRKRQQVLYHSYDMH